MDTPFDISRWQPTRPPNAGDRNPGPDELETLSRTLAAQTRDLRARPYDPEGWICRAETLRGLGLTELAVADAWKGGMMCRGLLEGVEEEKEGGWRLGVGRGFWMLQVETWQEGKEEKGLRGQLEVLEERARRVQERSLRYPNGEGTEGEGQFVPRPYPWLTEERSRRSDKLVERMNEEFAANARTALVLEQPFCEVRRHVFGNTRPESKDVLGVFATQDIPADAIILIDSTRIVGSAGVTANSRDVWACSPHPMNCRVPPDDSAGPDLRWVKDELGTGATSTLLTLRLLQAAVQDGFKSPLDHPLVARLTPNYPPIEYNVEPETFSLKQDIDIPMRALQQFGIDIFADLEWDSWVIFTIARRQENNQCGDAVSAAVMGLFSLFNHSCEPNVGWSRFREEAGNGNDSSSACANELNDVEADANDEHAKRKREGILDHSTVTVTTTRPIAKGEQIFVEYDSFVHSSSVGERRRRLRKWLSGDCMCTRCVREAAEEARRDSPTEENGRVDRMGKEKQGWDDSERVEFPEETGALKGQRLNMWCMR